MKAHIGAAPPSPPTAFWFYASAPQINFINKAIRYSSTAEVTQAVQAREEFLPSIQTETAVIYMSVSQAKIEPRLTACHDRNYTVDAPP